MRVASRRCAYCNLTRPDSSFTVWRSGDGRQVYEPYDKQCAVVIWSTLVAEYPALRHLRDVLWDLAQRAEPEAPSKGWDEIKVVKPLREGQKPDGITDDGSTFKTAVNSKQDRISKGSADHRIRTLWQQLFNEVYPDPSEKRKVRVSSPRCQKAGCNHRGKVGDTFCGKCGSEFSVRTKEAVG